MGYLLIVGAKSDIARALAHTYAKAGYDLYLAARNIESLESVVNDLIIRYQVNIIPLELDILDYYSHEKFYSSIEVKPAGVIFVVGYLGDPQKAETDFEEALKIMATNYVGCVSLLNIIANDFAARKNGFIVGISSVAGMRGRQSNYIYGSAKGAFAIYLSGLRNRLMDSNVHVLTIIPGFVRTKMTAGLNLPARLTADPWETAQDIFRAQQKKKDVVYTKWFWRWIMWIIIHLPEKIFKKMKL